MLTGQVSAALSWFAANFNRKREIALPFFFFLYSSQSITGTRATLNQLDMSLHLSSPRRYLYLKHPGSFQRVQVGAIVSRYFMLKNLI